MSMNQRGLAGIIATVVFIATSIVALAIVQSSLSTTFDLSPQLSCTELSINNPIKIISACYDADLKKVALQINHQVSAPQLSSLKVEISNEGQMESWICNSQCGTCSVPLAGSQAKYSFKVPTFTPQKATIKVDNCVLTSALILPCTTSQQP